MEKIINKAQYFQLWQAGLLGNKLRSWRTLEEVLASDYAGLISARAIVNSAAVARYGIEIINLKTVIGEMIDAGRGEVKEKDIIFNETAEDHCLTIQGEVMLSYRHYELYYSLLPDRMRPALIKGGQYAHGLVELQLLLRYVDPSSLSDIKEMLETYQDHVIEFGSYSKNVGCIRGRNTLIWECRFY
jgi:hypothetical protein